MFDQQSVRSTPVSSILPCGQLTPSELSVGRGYRGTSHPPLLFTLANSKDPRKCVHR